MKKLIPLLVFLLILAAGCGSKAENYMPQFNVDEGKQVVSHYLIALVKNDVKSQNEYLAQKLVNKKLIKDTDGQVVGFQLISSNEENNGAQYSGKLFQENTAKPSFVVSDLNVTMEMTADGDYRISDVKLQKTDELNVKNNVLYLNQNGTDTKLIQLSDLPASATPQGIPEKQLNFTAKSFGPLAISPDQRNLLVTANGDNAFVGKYNLDSKQISPVDIFPKSNITKVNWSQDGNIYLVEKKALKGREDIVLYDNLSDGQYPIATQTLFKDSQYNINQGFFDVDNFYFYVKTNINKSLSGWWLYNLKSKKIGKLLR